MKDPVFCFKTAYIPHKGTWMRARAAKVHPTAINDSGYLPESKVRKLAKE